MVFKPRPLPLSSLQLRGGDSIPDCCIPAHRAPSPPAAREMALLQGEARHFSSCSVLPAAEAKSRASRTDVGAPFFCSTPLVGWRLYLRQGVLGTLGPQEPFSWLVKWWRHIRRGKPSGHTPGYSLLFPYSECSPPRARCYSEKRLSPSHSHLQSPRLRDSAWREKQAIAQEASNLFPKEVAPFSTEYASSYAPQSSGECSQSGRKRTDPVKGAA